MTAPTIEILSDAITSPNRLHLAAVAAWMLYPDDREMRERILISNFVQHRLESLKAGEVVDQSMVPVLVEMALKATPPDELCRLYAENMRRGYTVGWIVLGAVIDKDGAGVMGFAINAARIALGGAKHSSSKHVNEVVWKKFRPVAALWAAFVLMNVTRADKNSLIDKNSLAAEFAKGHFPCDPVGLPRFLRLSEVIRVKAEDRKLDRRRFGVLEPGESVRFPAEVLAALGP